jgi:hypothetical protein
VEPERIILPYVYASIVTFDKTRLYSATRACRNGQSRLEFGYMSSLTLCIDNVYCRALVANFFACIILMRARRSGNVDI